MTCSNKSQSLRLTFRWNCMCTGNSLFIANSCQNSFLKALICSLFIVFISSTSFINLSYSLFLLAFSILKAKNVKQQSFQLQKRHKRQLAFNNLEMHLSRSASAKDQFGKILDLINSCQMFHTCKLWDLQCLLERVLTQSQTVKGKTSACNNCGWINYTEPV